MIATPYTYAATLVRVTDGDTVVVQLDLGLRLTATLPLRLLGINTPEMNTDAGRDARLWVIDWFETRPALFVSTAKDPEKYGRWLAVITAKGDPVSLNEALINAGVAVSYMV